VYTIKQEGPVHLYDEFTGSVLWKDISLWTDLFKRLVDMRVRSEAGKQHKGRFFNKMLSNVQKAISGKEDEESAAILVE
jgi:hypothetical protein